MTASARFFSKVGDPTERGCREWQACLDKEGYGHFRYEGRIVYAHRMAFFLENGRWPNGQGRHRCDNPRCCEASHILEGTHAENMADCAARGRSRSPRKGNGYVKIPPDVREVIRHRHQRGETNKSALAREYGITPTRIRQIVNGS